MKSKIFAVIIALTLLTTCQFREGFFYYMGVGNTITFGGNGFDSLKAITTDDAGNIYLAGTFYDTVDFNPREGRELKTAAVGNSDVYLIKLNADYTFSWSRKIGGNINEGCSGLVAADDMVYVGGNFSASIDLNPEGGGDFRTAVGGENLFITAYDGQGNYQWGVTRSDPVGDDLIGSKMLLDGSNNLYFFYNTSGGATSKIGLIKLNSRGEEIWGLQTPEGNNRKINDAAWGYNDKLYCVGYFMGGDQQYYLAEISSDGAYTSEWFFGGTNQEEFKALTAGREGLYIAGRYGGNSVIDNNQLSGGVGENAVLLKVNYSYQVEWVYPFRSRTAPPATLQVEGLATDGNYLFLSGYFDGEVNFNPFGEKLYQAPLGVRDIYLSTFKMDGSFVDTRVLQGKGNDYGSILHGGRGWIFWGGMYSGETDFKVENDSASDIRGSNGATDVFMTIIVE